MTPEHWKEIERLYFAALEREESLRAAYLHKACAGDEGLRREVESLLSQEKRGDALLEVPALEMAASAMAKDSELSLHEELLGSYKIASSLGAGGMGEVYQARDTKLNRDVAIKVLPAAFVHNAERLSRFQREARMLAALNHPNIATIHSLEQAKGVHYLVMELVPGQTLAERVSAGTLKVEGALKIAVQIAEALEAAHEKGVIHRDLKPANVKVTPEGRVKVLDFGLAKAFADDGGLDLSNAATLTAMTTEEGRILGTPAYMSPEQARGKPVDKRTDIWAFGCVLCEMLTGKKTFRGETVSDTIASVLEREPEWQALPPTTPAKIRELLRRCLQKDSQRRLRDIGDARIQIEETLAAPAIPEPSPSAKGIRARWRGTMVWGVASLLLAAVTSVTVWNLKPPSAPLPQPVSRFAITLPPGQQLAALESGPAVALSPDGIHLAYIARQDGVQQLYLRAMDSQEGKPIAGTEGAVSPFFSPDSEWLGFFAGGSLKKVSVGGGTVMSLANAALPRGASWGSQGIIAFAPTTNGALQQLPDAGGTARPLTRLGKGEISQRWPEFLPGGKTLLFASSANTSSWSNAQIAVQSVATGERRNLIQGGTNPRYAPSGHLVFSQGGSLMAVPFDPRRLVVTGPPGRAVERVLQSSVTGVAQYSFSSNGSVVYVPGGIQSAQSILVWVSRNGTVQLLAAPVRAYRGPRLSPDGRRVAVAIEEQESQTWLYDLSRETLTRLTFAGSANYNSSWTPDGKRVVFNSNKEGPLNLFWQLADGSGGLERLTNSQSTQAPMSWSPNGQVLAFIEVNPTTGRDIWMLRMSDPVLGPGQVRNPQLFLQTPFTESAPRFSPDGRWLAYVSDESGRFEIYVQPYPGPGGKWQISTEGGTEPVWNPNGRELFYRSGDKMLAVEVATQQGFTAGKPRMLFEGKYEPAPATFPNYDVSADGQRFLMLKLVEQAEAAPTQMNVVLNWFEELKQKVPTGKK
jgi:serine/threonine protein kinase/Tol biopolymer transport system component